MPLVGPFLSGDSIRGWAAESRGDLFVVERLQNDTHEALSLRFPIAPSLEPSAKGVVLGGLVCVFGRVASEGPEPFAWRAVLMQAVANHLAHLAIESEMRKQVRVREQFLAIASHELKTPLTSIYGILQLQERMLKAMLWPIEMKADQERHLSFLRLVIRQSERLTELIDGLLDVSKVQAGKFSIEPLVVELPHLISEVIEERFAPLARESALQILLEKPEALSAWVDPVRFEEVVNNLIMNAMRLSPEGGVIWVRLRTEGNDAVLSVRDQGQAISAEDRGKVFEPFERAKAVVRMGGLGLGLYLSRQIARLHGGEVVLLPNIASRGNVFEARFPVRKPSV
jgi:signal transduction histidine kinase